MPWTKSDDAILDLYSDSQHKRASSKRWKSFQLVEEEAKSIEAAQSAMRKTTSDHVLLIGQQLKLANDKLARFGEGTFLKWCAIRLELKKTTTYKWMRVADAFRDCPQCVQSIEPSALYLLSATTTPPKARRKAIQIATEGGVVKLAQAKDLVGLFRNRNSPGERKRNSEAFDEMKRCWKRLMQLWGEVSDAERYKFNQWRSSNSAARLPKAGDIHWVPRAVTREEMFADDEEVA